MVYKLTYVARPLCLSILQNIINIVQSYIVIEPVELVVVKIFFPWLCESCDLSSLFDASLTFMVSERTQVSWSMILVRGF